MAPEATRHSDIAGLMREIARYLAAVDAFRAEGREPRWAAEWPASGPAGRPSRRRQPLALS